jgi:hypothetical protein
MQKLAPEHLRRGLYVVVALMLAAMTPVLLALRRDPEAMGLQPDGDGPSGVGVKTTRGETGPGSGWSRRIVMRDRAFLTMSIPFALGLLDQVGFLADVAGVKDQIRSTERLDRLRPEQAMRVRDDTHADQRRAAIARFV